MTLIEFLMARIAEDEAEARSSDGLRMPEVPPVGSWGPLRVLAECEAKRRIVDEHRRVDPESEFGGKDDPEWVNRCSAGCGGDMDDVYQRLFKEPRWPCATLRIMALPYADHPQYRKKKWKV